LLQSISQLFSLTFRGLCFRGFYSGSWIHLPLYHDVNGNFLAQIRHFITQFRTVFKSSDNLQLQFNLLSWYLNLTALASLVRKWHKRKYILAMKANALCFYIYLRYYYPRYYSWKNSSEEVSNRPVIFQEKVHFVT